MNKQLMLGITLLSTFGACVAEGDAGLTTDAAARGYPGQQACETCNSIESCQQLMNSIIDMFPDYAARGTEVTFETWQKGEPCNEGKDKCCMRQWDSIKCPTSWVEEGKITNKMLFHELNHALREGLVDADGEYGECYNGACNSSELQASIMEFTYFSGPEAECLGGHYSFTDSNGVTRTAAELGAALQQSPAVPEAALWDYAMGREDTLAPHLDRLGVTETADLYHSQTYRW